MNYFFEMLMMTGRRFVEFLIILSLSFLNLEGQNSWYLDQEHGNDLNPGNADEKAFQSMNHILDNDLLAPGDTLFLIGEFVNLSYDPDYHFLGDINDPHIWHQENTLKINNLHGLPGQYITIKAYNKNTVLKGDGANILRLTNCSYLCFEGLNICGEVERIPIETALALQFLYREANSLNTKYRVPPGSSPEEVANMTLAVLSGITRPSYTDTRGLYFTNVHHVELVNNHIHHTPGNGFRIAEGDYISIVGNEVDNTSRKSYSGTHGLVVTKSKSIDENEGSKILITGNKVHHNYNEIYSWAPSKTFITPHIDEGKGISLQRNTVDRGWTHGRIKVVNNICYWNGFSGIHSNEGDRIDFINNSCYLNSYTNTITNAEGEKRGNNIGISTSGGKDIRIINNIIVIDDSFGAFPISVRESYPLTVRNNLIYGIHNSPDIDSDLSGIEINTIEGDPLFLDPASNDFHIAYQSPAIDSADPSFAPEYDFNGIERDELPDIGAIEWFNSSNITNGKKDLFICKIYPNPFSKTINVNANIDNTKYIELYDSSLRKVKCYDINPGNSASINEKLDLRELANGLYLLKIGKYSKWVYKINDN